MSNYEQLDRGLVRAIQSGQIEDFINEINRHISSRDFTRWLFLARAYDAKGEPENARNAYIHVARLANPKYQHTKLLAELQQFVNRYGFLDVVEVANQCFGPGSITLAPEATPSHPGKYQSEAPSIGNGHTPATPDSNSQKKAVPAKAASTGVTAEGTPKEASGKKAPPAQEKVEKGAKRAERDYAPFLERAQELQHLQRYAEALEVLDSGLQRVAHHTNALALLTLKAQILSSQQEWERAVEVYETLVVRETRPGAKRFARIQLVHIYSSRLGEHQKALEIVDSILQSNPQDQVAIRLRNSLTTGLPLSANGTDDGQILQEFQIEQVPNIRPELVSPMLLDDIDAAQFQDEQILLKGGQPDSDDAERLLRLADETTGSEFGELYPRYLEAAKAYSKLPEGSYRLGNFHRAMANYALLKGGALVSAFRRQLDSEQTDLEELKRLRDSATSYYLESLNLQAEVKLDQVIIQITNYLRIQLAYALFKRNEPVKNLFKRNLNGLLDDCIKHPSNDIARIAYETVVSCGAAGEKVWKKVQFRAGGAFSGKLNDETARREPYKILSEMSNKEFEVQQKPRDVLQAAFFARFDQTNELSTFFNTLEQIPLTLANLPDLHTKWQGFPLYRGPLLDTDIELYERVGKILETLRLYLTRGAEERTSILYTTRTSIEQLLDSIQKYPTYWGRVGFARLLTKWRAAIQKIEQRRLEELQPRLIARLESGTFACRDEYVEGGIFLENTGLATAEAVSLVVELSTNKGEVLHRYEEDIEVEIAVGKNKYWKMRFPRNLFSEGLDIPYNVRIQVIPTFHQEKLEGTISSFTLEIESGESGPKFTEEEIPWSELNIPPRHLFKGREQFIDLLANHLRSSDRQKTYLLYGLTRTGKSTILRYLGEKIDLQPFTFNGEQYRFISFEWELAKAASLGKASDMWLYFLQTCILEKKCSPLLRAGKLQQEDVPLLRHSNTVRFHDWEEIVDHFHSRKLYPIFLIDEFSYYRQLIDNGQITSAVLASIRSFAIENRASFVFAGTYDLKELIRDQKYGVTGQFINIIEQKVSRIDRAPAVELIRAMEPKLLFTEDAIDYILFLSFRIPYFIQIICRNCAQFALKTGRSYLGFPEVNIVIQALTGEPSDIEGSVGVARLPARVFMNNLQADSDPIEYQVLLSSICHLVARTQHPSERPRMVTGPEIHELWHRRGLDSFQGKFARAIEELLDREVLIYAKDEGLPAYRISVDLFRRWWAVEHPEIDREIDKLKHTK